MTILQLRKPDRSRSILSHGHVTEDGGWRERVQGLIPRRLSGEEGLVLKLREEFALQHPAVTILI